jgi:hypothetical protein
VHGRISSVSWQLQLLSFKRVMVVCAMPYEVTAVGSRAAGVRAVATWVESS